MPPTNTVSNHAFVIPAFGLSPYLTDCLGSIAAQTVQGSKVVITTSTPSRDLDDLAARYQVPVMVNRLQAGIGGDWNFALFATSADFVTLAHQDDMYRPDYLERLLPAMRSAPDVLIGFSDYQETTKQGVRPPHVNMRIKQFLCRRAFGGKPTIRATRTKRKMLAWGNPVCCPSVILNRRLLSGFRFTEDMRSNLDWEAWLRLAGQPGAFVYVPEPLAIRRIHEGSETSATIADQRRELEDLEMFTRLWPAPVARLIMRVYRASYLANRT